MQIGTRQEAIAAHRNKYFTGEPCKSGHVAERYTQSGTCEMCIRASSPYPTQSPESAAHRLQAQEQRAQIARMRADQSQERIAIAKRKLELAERRLTLRPKPKRSDLVPLFVVLHWGDVETFKTAMLLQAQMSDALITLPELISNKAIENYGHRARYPFKCYPVDFDDLHALANGLNASRVAGGNDEDAIYYREEMQRRTAEAARLRAIEDEDNGRPEKLDA